MFFPSSTKITSKGLSNNSLRIFALMPDTDSLDVLDSILATLLIDSECFNKAFGGEEALFFTLIIS